MSRYRQGEEDRHFLTAVKKWCARRMSSYVDWELGKIMGYGGSVAKNVGVI